MTDTRTIGDRVRAFVVDGESVEAAELHRIAGEYARACEQVNARLRRCMDYVRRGLRSEAIHLAEIEPPVLEELAHLELPHRDLWRMACRDHQLPASPPLLADDAAELNSAYAQEQRLAPLLRSHRTLALARAPLRERIAVLGELEREDPSGPWAADAAALQKVRLKQVGGEVNDAIAREDVAALQRLQAELSGTWKLAVPPLLLSRVNAAVGSLRSRTGEEKLRELIPAIDAAYGAMSLSESERWVAAWREVVEQYQVEVPPDLVDYLQPVEAWIEQQHAQAEAKAAAAAACGELQEMIDHDRPIEDIDRVHRRIVSMGTGMPADTERAYQQAKAKVQQVRQQVRRRRLGMVAAAMLVVCGAAAWYVWGRMQDRQARDLAAWVGEAIRERRFDDAKARLQQAAEETPSVATLAPVREASRALATAEQQEADRERKFVQAMTQTESEDPAVAGRAATLAESLAIGQDERDKAAAAKQRVEQAARGREAARSGRLSEVLRELGVAAGQLEQSLGRSSTQSDAILARIGELEAELNRLGTPDAEQMVAADAARARIHRVMTDLTNHDRHEVAWLAVRTAAVGDPASLARALKDYARVASDSVHAADAQAAAALEPRWNEVLQWQAMLERWSARTPGRTPEQISQRLLEVKAYRQAFPKSMFDAVAADCEGLFEAQLVVLDLNGDLQVQLRRILNNPLVRDLQTVQVPGKREVYYVKLGERPEPMNVGGSWINAVLTPDLAVTKRTLLRGEARLTPKASPQSEAARKIVDRLQATNAENVATLLTDLTRIICTEPDMDPLFAGIMLVAIAPLQDATPWIADPTLQKAVGGLAALDVEQLMWMDPNDEAAERSRPACRAELDRFADHGTRAAAMQRKYDDLMSALRPRLLARGILDGFSGERRWHGATTPPDRSVIHAIVAGPDGRTMLLKVGDVSGGEVRLNPAASTVPIGALLVAYRAD